MRGQFITFEGIEGVGKTTQLRHAAKHLREHGITVLATREPGGTQLAEMLRNWFLDHKNAASVSAEMELLLLFSARADHFFNKIKPALDRGEWVLSDRFTDSTVAYQHGGRGVSLKQINELANIAHPETSPDLTLLLDAPIAVARNRVESRELIPDRIENESNDFFVRVRNAYLELAKREPDRVQVVDASQPEMSVAREIAKVIDARTALCGSKPDDISTKWSIKKSRIDSKP